MMSCQFVSLPNRVFSMDLKVVQLVVAFISQQLFGCADEWLCSRSVSKEQAGHRAYAVSRSTALCQVT